ncbi:MAG: hypothetical protein ACX930_07005 [Erythrobacter sp.]
MKLFAILALVPLAIGPLPQDDRTLTISLCLGGEIIIPLDGGEKKQDRDCHQQACHAGSCREKTKRSRS